MYNLIKSRKVRKNETLGHNKKREKGMKGERGR